MGFFDAIERFDKKYKMSEPCFWWHKETRWEIPAEEVEEVNELRAENRRLKKLIGKLLERGIIEEDDAKLLNHFYDKPKTMLRKWK